MVPKDYELVAQIGAGPDGVSFRAIRSSERHTVELRVLAAARADPRHWSRLTRRLRLARLADHPGARRVLHLDLDAETPTLVLEWTDGPSLAEALAGRVPLPPGEALALACDLAGTLLAAHRLGLAHGALAPASVRVADRPSILLDFTGTATFPGESRLIASEMDLFGPDVHALARILQWLLTGKREGLAAVFPVNVPTAVSDLIGTILKRPPADAPALAEVEAQLRESAQSLKGLDQLMTTRVAGPSPVDPPSGVGKLLDRLGRFRLEEMLGRGGMGLVYRATDPSDGNVVAIKTLLADHANRADMVRRFQKEARLLREVNSPFVANCLEVNEDAGVHYLALEFVAGRNAGQLLEELGKLAESFALAILRDVCQALAVAHAKGVVHRDVKPENILLLAAPGTDHAGQVAKLSDFGLARHVVESESLNLTRTGAILGTPLYLSPEQCVGEPVDARSDVYGAGATLFHLIAGRPPYLGDGPLAVMQMHRNAPIPSLKTFVPDVSDGVCRLVEKALAKAPGHRHADATELLDDIERLRRGEVASVELHPRLPTGDPGRVVKYEFTWDLESSPADLWPFVSNTERLNRAVGLPATNWTVRRNEQGLPRRDGRIKPLGIEMAWQEHPFEWVEGRRFAVLREFESGPFRWFVSQVELSGHDGGTKLTHRFRIEPSGLVGRAVAAAQIGVGARRSLERVYRRIDAVVKGKGGTFADHFEEPPKLPPAARQRLDEGLDGLARRGVDPGVTERLGAYLATAPAQELTRIRPVALARRLGLDADATVAGCLHAAREGLLILLWDLICPLCRVPSEVKDTLKTLKDHGRCEACNLDYELDFGQAVEMVFRADPSIREAELGIYCIGGPAHSPHVVAQVRLAPGEQMTLPLELMPGAYRLAGPQLPVGLEARVEAGPHATRWDVDVSRVAERKGQLMILRPGGQVLSLGNPLSQEVLVRLERTAQRDDAVTAARSAALALFRELFPGEVLSPGRLVTLANVTLWVTELTDLKSVEQSEGEAKAFGRLHEHLRQVEAAARRHGGALVKAVGDGALAAFAEPVQAARAMLELSEPSVRSALHRGPARAATINDHLDYFGATVRQALAILGATAAGERLVSQEVMSDPTAMALLREFGAALRHGTGLESLVVHRLGTGGSSLRR